MLDLQNSLQKTTVLWLFLCKMLKKHISTVMYKENENVTHRVICKWSSKILTRSSFLLRRARYKHFQAKASSVTILRKQSANLTSESSVRNPKWRSLKNIRVFTSYVFVAISPTKVPSVRSYWHNLFYSAKDVFSWKCIKVLLSDIFSKFPHLA